MRKVLKVSRGDRIYNKGRANLIILPPHHYAFKLDDTRQIISSPKVAQIQRDFRLYADLGYTVTWIKKP